MNLQYPPDQIILVDDGSQDDGQTDDVARRLERLAKEKGIDFEYVYINHPEARVSSYPRNVGLRKTKHEIVMFTEPECLHVGETIKQMKDRIEADPMKVYVATQIWTMGQSIWNKLSEDEFAHPEKIIQHPYAQLTDAIKTSNTKAPDSDWAITGSNNCFAGCLLGTLREHFMACRGFNEKFKRYGYDDWDMINRVALYLNKKKNIEPDGTIPVNHENCNDIVVIHQWHTKNYPDNIYEAAEENGRMMADMIEKENEHRANLDHDNWGLL
jgi:N-terminal domain of galactosyltransferase